MGRLAPGVLLAWVAMTDKDSGVTPRLVADALQMCFLSKAVVASAAPPSRASPCCGHSAPPNLPAGRAGTRDPLPLFHREGAWRKGAVPVPAPGRSSGLSWACQLAIVPTAVWPARPLLSGPRDTARLRAPFRPVSATSLRRHGRGFPSLKHPPLLAPSATPSSPSPCPPALALADTLGDNLSTRLM